MRLLTREMKDARGQPVQIRRNDADAIKTLSPWQRAAVLVNLALFCTFWLWAIPLVELLAVALHAFFVAPDIGFEGIVIGTLSVSLLAPLVWLIWPSRINRSVARMRVSRNMCGACQYNMTGLAHHQADQAVVRCPECGACWSREWLDPKP